MFKIYDGRDAFYQWDLNRKLIVEDKSIKEVHFCNRTSDCSLITEVYELEGLYVADVPNILLQDNWDIKVYAYDSEYTKHCETYDVIARTRPDDYVYTETEQRKWEHLEARIDEIEQNGISEESIRNAVEKYLDENGVEVDLTGYATETYVNDALAAIVIPDVAISLASGTTITDATVRDALVDIFNNGMSKAVFINGNQMVAYKTSGALSTGATINFYGFKPTANTENKVTTTVYQATIKSTSVEISNAMTGTISGLATEKYVDDAIANLDIPEADVDLSNYYTKTETETAINNAKPDLSGYALKTEIPDTTEFMTEDDVDDFVSGELKTFAKKSYVDNAIEEALEEFTPSSGEGGSAVEEVYVGTEEPEDENIKLWINPEEEGGSVKVDGTTIIKNLDGTISTALGGGKELAAEPVAVYTYQLPSNSLGFTLYGSDNNRYASKSYNFLNELDKNVQYTVELGFHTPNATQAEGSCVGTIAYSTINGDAAWYATGLAVFDDVINLLGYSSSQGVYLDGSSRGSKYGEYYIRHFRVLTPAQYNYVTIDSNYINIGDGLVVGADGKLKTTLAGITVTHDGSLVGSNSTISTTSMTSSIVFGEQNSVNKTGGSETEAAVVLGRYNYASGYGAVTIGSSNKAYYANATAIGSECEAPRKNTIAVGHGAKAGIANQSVFGSYNVIDSAGNYRVIIGNGIDGSLANGLTISPTGNVVTQGTISNGGADYAEYFEWLDGNPEDEDRIGYIVALEGDKIRLAQAGDDILGIVSGTATVLGDDAEWHWHKKYLRDEFGRVQSKIIQLYDEDGNPDGYATVPVVNPEYDEKQHYVPRSERAAWDAIGMMGKLYVRDDGSCVVGGYAAVAADGLASFSTGRTNMRVMERISDGIVRVLLK